MRLTPEQVTSAQHEIEQGQYAAQITDNPIWTRLRSEIDEDIRKELLLSAIDDHQKLVNIKLFAQAMAAMEAKIRHLVNSGKLAGESLRLHYEAEQSAGDR